MPRTLISIPILAAIGLLAGCSVFGVATKAELDAAVNQESAARLRTESRLESLTEDLESLERRLRPRLATLDSTLVRTTAEVAMVTERWDGLRHEMASELDSLAASQDKVWLQLMSIRNGLAAAREDLGLARENLSAVSVRSDRAQRDSRQALQLHEDALLRERQWLQERLADLELRLQDLDRVLTDSTGTDASARPAAPDTAAAGVIEIRGVSAR